MGNFFYRIRTPLGVIDTKTKTIKIDLDQWRITNKKQIFQFKILKRSEYDSTWKYEDEDYTIVCKFAKLRKQKHKRYYQNQPRLRITINIKKDKKDYGTLLFSSYNDTCNDLIFST